MEALTEAIVVTCHQVVVAFMCALSITFSELLQHVSGCFLNLQDAHGVDLLCASAPACGRDCRTPHLIRC